MNKDNKTYLPSEVTDEDFKNAVMDEHGVWYSVDGKRLIFCYAKDLKEYAVREGTEVICDDAFHMCFFLGHVSLPDGLRVIGTHAFDSCEGLTAIYIPDSVTLIKEWAFVDCMTLEEINLPMSLTQIEGNVFDGCWNIYELELPENLIEIDGNPFAFSGISIKSKSPLFKVENDLLIQGNKVLALSGTPEEVIVPDYIKIIGRGAFSGNYSLSSISLPEGLTTIEEDAFEECHELCSIRLPSTIKTIGECAFCDSAKLTSVFLPEGVITIEDYAFSHCYKLKKIHICCSPDADETTVLNKFRGMLKKELYDKLEIVKEKYQKN